MKKYLLLLTLVVVFTTSFAQVHKFIAVQSAVKYYENNRWTEWTDWKDVNILIVINLDDTRIRIYSEIEQDFFILRNDDIEYLDKHSRMTIYCVDKDGIRCHVEIVRWYNDEDAVQLYVKYSDAEIAYNLERRD